MIASLRPGGAVKLPRSLSLLVFRLHLRRRNALRDLAGSTLIAAAALICGNAAARSTTVYGATEIERQIGFYINWAAAGTAAVALLAAIAAIAAASTGVAGVEEFEAVQGALLTHM